MKYLNKEQSYLLLELCIDYSLFICITIDTKCRFHIMLRLQSLMHFYK